MRAVVAGDKGHRHVAARMIWYGMVWVSFDTFCRCTLAVDAPVTQVLRPAALCGADVDLGPAVRLVVSTTERLAPAVACGQKGHIKLRSPIQYILHGHLILQRQGC